MSRPLEREEVETDYEVNVGRVIVERLAELKPADMPAVLVASHGPFTWGKDAVDSMQNSVILEEVAKSALATLQLDDAASPLPQYLLDKHFLRKHGTDAYYGQRDQ